MILVTGASGFLGSHIARRLDAQGTATRLLVRASSNRSSLEGLTRATFAVGDVRDPGSLRRAAEGVTGVIHAAGLVKARDPRDFARVNTEGTQALLEAVADVAPDLLRFVLVSSLAAHGPSPDGRPRPVAAPARPVTAYGRSKWSAEQAATSAAGRVPVTIVRPPMIYGPGDREVLAFFRAVRWRLVPLTGPPQSLLSTIFVEDCADACIAALAGDLPSGSCFFVDDGQPEPLIARLRDIERAVGRPALATVRVPPTLLRVGALLSEWAGHLTGRSVMLTRDKVHELTAPHWVGESAPARAALQWSPRTSFADGAHRTAAWYRRVGWL